MGRKEKDRAWSRILGAVSQMTPGTKKYVAERLSKIVEEETENLTYYIKRCCPDQGSALEEESIFIKDATAFIMMGGARWDLDFCPFCGEDIVVVTQTKD